VAYQFRDGKMTSFSAQQNAKCLQNYLDAYTGAKDVVASMQIGLNPNLRSQSRTAPFDEAGMVWLSLGRDDRVGVTGTQMYWSIPVVNATLQVDGRTVIKDGKLQMP
jgi:aminopeptidase